MVKHDIQYGEWNYYTLQCGMWLWNNDSEFTNWQHPAMWYVAVGWHAIEFAQTSAVLEFYFPFRFRPYHHSRRVILHHSAKFYPNWTTLCRHNILWSQNTLAARFSMQTVAAVIIIVSYWFWWWIVAPECGIYDGERLRYPYWITFENDQEIPEKGPNFRSHLGSKSYKVFSFRGASPPWPGALPLNPAGGSAPRPPL